MSQIEKITLRIKVFAESSSNKIIEEKGKLLIYVKAKKKNLEANNAVLEVLSKRFKSSPDKVRITKGTRSQNKTVEIIC